MAPLVVWTPCHVEAWAGDPALVPDVSPAGFITKGRTVYNVPKIGTFLIIGTVSGALAATLLDPLGRFDVVKPLHRWARRYAFTVMLQCAVQMVAWPWLFAICPSRTVTYHGVLRSVVALVYAC